MTSAPLAMIVVGVAALAAAPAAQDPQVFRTIAEAVTVDVSVRAGSRPIAGLAAGDFEVRDNGVVQKITDLSRETLPIAITLVVDVSASVRGPLLESLQRALGRVLGGLGPEDRCSIVVFNEAIRKLVAAGSPAPRTAPALAPVGPMGLTSVFDALTMSLITRDEPGRRQMAVLFTDGRDTVSFLDETSVVAIAKRTDPAVFVVAAVDRGRPPHERLFNDLADATGGRVVVIPRAGDVSASFLQAVQDFRASYVLRYSPEGVARAGWHEIGVRVTRPGTYEVRARKGYQGIE